MLARVTRRESEQVFAVPLSRILDLTVITPWQIVGEPALLFPTDIQYTESGGRRPTVE